MAYVSERGKASDYLRELAAQIDDGVVDVVSFECTRLTAREATRGQDFSVHLDLVMVNVASGVAAVVSDTASVLYVDGRPVGNVTNMEIR